MKIRKLRRIKFYESDTGFPGFRLVPEFRIFEEKGNGVHPESVDTLSVDPEPDDILKGRLHERFKSATSHGDAISKQK
jgi:hypothetical protein